MFTKLCFTDDLNSFCQMVLCIYLLIWDVWEICNPLISYGIFQIYLLYFYLEIANMASFKVTLNADQANKINKLLPTGYKIVLIEDIKKRQVQSKKKSKVVYVPLDERPLGSRIKKQTVSYREEDFLESNSNVKKIHYDIERQKQRHQQIQRSRMKSQLPPSAQSPQQHVIEQRPPYTPKQVIQKIEKHPKYHTILQFRDDFSQSSYDTIVSKCQGTFYNLHELQDDLQKIFMKIYESYNHSMSIYGDAAELEAYINNMITAQKVKLKEIKKEEIAADDSLGVSKNLTINRKKTTFSKPEIKNMTIMDKRTLGQNIKKLAPEYLPEIVKIVFDTIETREQYEIDIDTLPLKKLKELQIYVGGCLQRDGVIDLQIKNDGDSSESSFLIVDDFD